jgi:hypothetical protein
VLVRAPGEVEDQPLPGHLRAHAQREIAVGRLEHVLVTALAVGERRQTGSCAPLGVVEHCVGGLAQTLWAELLRERGQAQRAGAVGRQLRAQIGAPLLRLAHLSRQLLDRTLVQRTR